MKDTDDLSADEIHWLRLDDAQHKRALLAGLIKLGLFDGKKLRAALKREKTSKKYRICIEREGGDYLVSIPKAKPATPKKAKGKPAKAKKKKAKRRK